MSGIGNAVAGTTGEGFVLVAGGTYTIKDNKPAVF